jgi:hypothetical protein
VWKHHCLAALAETSNVTRSTEIANLSVSRAYRVRREDAVFRAAWQEALCEGYDHLELEVLRRLREGDSACLKAASSTSSARCAS